MDTMLERVHETSRRAEFPFPEQEDEADFAIRAASNVRSISFIAKPGCASDLTAALKGQVLTLLRKAPGFDGAMLLHSHKEWRNVTVLTFWETESQAIHTRWEEFQGVRKLIAPLVDLCTKVQTFQGTLPEIHLPSMNHRD
jgi:heme-degrading monooxygenase HmoA